MRHPISDSIALVLLAALPGAAFAGLNGSSVIIDTRYPNLATTIDTVGPTTVTVGFEFPSFLGGAWSSNIDDTQIALTQLAPVNNFGPASFNGFVYSFGGATTITGVTVDGASTLNPTSVTWTGSSVLVNYSGAGNITANKTTLLNLTFVPEPTSAAGLALLATIARRRR